MGGSSFPSYGKSPAAAAAIGKPNLKQALALKVPKMGPAPKAAAPKAAKFNPGILKVGAMPKQRTAFHVNTSIPRGHIVAGTLRGPR